MKNVPYIIAVVLGLVWVALGIIGASFRVACLGLTFIVFSVTIWIMNNYIRELESINGNLEKIASEALKSASEALEAAREANDSDMRHIGMVEGLNKGMEILLKGCDFDMADRLNTVLEEYNLRIQEDDDGELRLFVKK